MSLARTSQSHPLQIAPVRASAAYGRIGITFCPGKHDRFAMTGRWERDLATDLDAIAAWGARLVLTLVEPAELVALRVPDLGLEVQRRGMRWCHLPIADFSVPTELFERQWQARGPEIRGLLRGGDDVLVHCKGGLGRAGMIAARLLAELGLPPEQAVREVRRARPGAIETPGQLALVRATGVVADDDAIDVASMRRVGASTGSHPGGVFEDDAGRRFHVKTLESPEHARNERLAARLYRLAGAPTLRYVPTRAPDQVATVWTPLERRPVARFTEAERRQAQRWFGVHAWTANWDAAGFAGDNQGVSAQDGTVLTLDVGGALEFRAQGEPKGRAFGDRVGELDLMRTDPGNPHAVHLFGDMDAAALREAIAVVVAIAPERIRETVAAEGGRPALAERLVARQADMAGRLTSIARPVSRKAPPAT